MKPLLVVFYLFLQFSFNNAPSGDIIDDLALQFKNGNSKEIAKSFAGTVELIIIDQEDVYSKAQSEQILRDFFLKNTAQKTTIIHRLSSSPNYRFGIISLTTKNGKFRVTVTLKFQKPANVFVITELKIEKEEV